MLLGAGTFPGSGAGLSEDKTEWQATGRKLTLRPRVGMASTGGGSGHFLEASVRVPTNVYCSCF